MFLFLLACKSTANFRDKLTKSDKYLPSTEKNSTFLKSSIFLRLNLLLILKNVIFVISN